MKTVFADTYFYLALVNPRDQGHAKAVAYAGSARSTVVVTDWIATELGDALCASANRHLFARLQSMIRGGSTTLIRFEDGLFQRGLDLYAARADKDWSLTDCISFVVMTEQGITEALTADHHFEQAGFVAVLK